MSDSARWDRMMRSMRVAFGAMPGPTTGGQVLDWDGVLATVMPTVPERSLPNSVLYEDEDALIEAIPALASAYEEVGVFAWTVWVPEHHRRARAALAAAGHTLDATPTAMLAELADVDPPSAGDPEPHPQPSLDDLARVNDLAYGTNDVFTRIIGSGPADPRHNYVARIDGEAAATVVSQDHDGDCSIWWVATIPPARGRGLSSGLLRRALADGRERGCEVSTLQATKLGRPVYERLGYRSLGTLEMWERRRG